MNDANLSAPPYPPAPPVPPYGVPFPMNFGQILERIFHLMRAHIRPFAAIGLVPIGALFVLEAAIFGGLFVAGVFKQPSAQPNVAAMLWIVFPAALLILPVALFTYGIYYGAANYAALQADNGLKVTAGEALRHAWSKLGRYTWLLVLRSLIVAIPMLVLFFLVGVGGLILGLVPNGNANAALLFLLIPLAALAYLGGIVYAILMSLRLSLAFPACVHEGLTAGQALRRSGVLTQGAKGRIFLALLVIYAIGYAAFMILYAVCLFIVAIGAFAGLGNIHAITPMGYVAIGVAIVFGATIVLLWTVLFMAAYSTAFAVFYRDQCLRKQGPPPVAVPAAIGSEI